MDEMSFALKVLFLGFSVVMVTLLLLYFILIIFSRLLNRTVKKAEPAAPVCRTKAATVLAAGIPVHVAAVITAAIYSLRHGHPDRPVRISISPGAAARPGIVKNWAAAGRKTLLESSLEVERLRRKRLNEKV